MITQFICVDALPHSQHVFSYVRTFSYLPWLNQYKAECLAQGHYTAPPMSLKLATLRYQV